MAVRSLILRTQVKKLRSILKDVNAAMADFSTREKVLEEALENAKSDEETDKVEADIKALEQEQKKHCDAVNELVKDAGIDGFDNAGADIKEQADSLTSKINELENSLNESEARTSQVHIQQRSAAPVKVPENINGGNVIMAATTDYRSRVAAIVQRDDVKAFLNNVRNVKNTIQTRGVNNTELTVPDVMLPLLRENVERASKLYSLVTIHRIKGKARQNIMAAPSEGVWTESVGKLNEISIGFNQIEFDGYKVGGFIAIPNSNLEDSDEDLASEILTDLGASIGYALDKAIAYGTGTKMPVGIVTRLAQTVKPDTWGTNAPAWVDLHTSNIIKFSSTQAALSDAKFFAEFILATSAMSSKWARGMTEKAWIMNEKTHKKIIAKSLAFNAAGAIVAGVNNTMPILGGQIIELDFMADDDILGGYIGTYNLIERKTTQLAQSEHYLFTDDQTVFKGTARYDGMPVFGEGFVAININNKDFTTSVTFAPDTANKAAESAVVENGGT